jgi:putative nucleotidyltransferase with HDIG domain
MKIETTFLRSRVAIRIFVLFVCCALLPIAVLAILSYSQVTKQLNEQTQKRLHQATKDAGGIIVERLYFLESEMKETAFKLSRESNPTLQTPAEGVSELLKERFKGLTIIADKGENILLFGHIQNIPKLTLEQKQHIRSGRAYVSSEHFPDSRADIFMSMAVDPRNPRRGILLGKIAPAYLWGSTNELPLPPKIELCILDQLNNVLFSSLPGPVSFPEQVILQMSRSALGQFEWVHGEKEYLASYRSIFRQSPLFIPKWTVVLSESKSDVLAPAANFKKIFLLTLLMSLWVVLLLSIVQIRRNLIPLEKLQEGTRRIATQDFNSPVTIKSGDEFEELGASFNAMASRLSKQFNTLTTMGDIDRAILSALDTEKIIGVVLSRMPDVFPCNYVSVTLLSYKGRIVGRTYTGSVTTDKENVVEAIELSAKEVEELVSHPESLFIELGEAVPGYLAPIVQNGIKAFLILPIVLKKKLSGFITLGWSLKSTIHTQEDFDRARQLADQIGVALSNAGLIRELNEFNWGTLEALARAIDAKSHWTAGHSERVTRLALKIGRFLGLTQEEMDVLHRAGLLHDIGKLGIPMDILDKEGKLSKKEEQLMREHVRLGLRILEPIAAYNEVVSIVSHHHESFDGEGYPDGLAGKDISLGGRIFAVSDSFDALTSNRPYRQALDREYAIEMIKQGSGSRYDPDIVRAFLEVMAQERGEGEA